MRIVTFIFAVALVGLSCTLQPASGAEETPSILFAVHEHPSSDGVVSGTGAGGTQIGVEPVAFVSHGVLTQLPSEPDMQAFGRSYYSKGRTYNLLVAGAVAGKVSIDAFEVDAPCASLDATGTAMPAGSLSGKRTALASDLTFGNPHVARRDPKPDERENLIRVAQQVYRTHGVDEGVAKGARVRDITVFERGGQALLIGSFDVQQKRREKGEEDVYLLAAFVILERSGDGKYVPGYEWFHSGAEGSIETQDLVDILDLDGSGSLRVVTHFGYYESDAYHVIQKKGNRWADVYQQSGGGC